LSSRFRKSPAASLRPFGDEMLAAGVRKEFEMATKRSKLQMSSAVACGLALIALMSGTAMAANPSSSAYYYSSHPMISGTVVTVNDHQMVVNTDQGEQVTLEIDTHTMAPRDLGPGMIMRADFQALEDCRLYAKQILPLRGSNVGPRTQAYANTIDTPEVILRNATASGRGHLDNNSARTGDRVTEPQSIGEHSPGATMNATPSTSDYLFSTRPMISGRVITVNDHRLIMATEQGQQVGMVMDSRTMLPAAVAPNMLVRAEFTRLKDGRYYVTEARLAGNSVAEREQAYAHTVDSQLLLAENVSDCGPVFPAPASTVSSIVDDRRPVVAENVPVSNNDERPETLPQTAGHQGLFLLLGLLSLGSGGLLAIAKGSRHA